MSCVAVDDVTFAPRRKSNEVDILMVKSDIEIFDEIRRGGKHHFAQLVDRYKDRALTLALRILKNREDAEEAVQDAFIKTYNALERFEGKSKFGTWFYRIVYNTCLSKLGSRNHEFQSIEYDDEYDEAVSVEENSSVIELDQKEMIALVKTIVETLPAKYGSILSLFYFQELSHAEICEVTQLPLGTVKAHLFRARAMLQEQVRKELRMEKVVI